MCCGKPVDGNGAYYFNATEDYVKHLVESMPASSMKGRNISMDRLYTSISTSNWLLARNITSVGTLVSNRVRLPDEVRDVKDRDELDSSMHWEQEKGNLALCAYTTKSKSKGKKNVLVLSTMQQLMGITRDDGKQKSVIIKFYDFTKGGKDILDQKISKYLCKLVAHRWTMVPFFSLLDAIACNAVTMYEIKHGKPHGKINAFKIGWDLVMCLVQPFIEVRPAVRLGIGLRSKVFLIIGRNNNEIVEAEA